QPAWPRTHLDHSNALQRPANARYAGRQVQIEQEILPQFLFGAQPMLGDHLAQRWQIVDLAHWFAVIASAMTMAARKLLGEARPVPARSNAVPWSGEVRTIGSPSVTLTA